MATSITNITIHTPHGEVQSIWMRPDNAVACYVLAHGAGAGMNHTFMNDIAQHLADRNIATLRYEFLYMTRRGRIDPEPVLFETIRAAIDHAKMIAPELPRIAGGKSMGGRMTSRACAVQPLDVEGIAFIGFPLHPPKKVASDRAVHLHDVALPMLFLQGTRDDLADMPSMKRVIDELGPRATLHVVEGADHSFHVLKRSGRSDAEVMDELADTITSWRRSLS